VTSRRLKVLSIAHSAVNRTSGRLRYEALVDLRDDIDLTLVAPARYLEYGKPMKLDPHEGPMDFRVEPVRLPYLPRVGWYLLHYPGLGRLIEELRPEVIHLWEEPWSLAGLQAILLRDRMAPRSAVLLETDQNILRRLPPPFEQIRRYTLRRVDLLIGRQDESLAVSRACGYAGPTAIVEYGVAPGVFGRQDRAAARAELGVDGFTIGYVGRIVPEKGLHDVLDAMAACAAPVTFVVVGAGADRDAVVAHARRLGLAERVRLLEPRQPAEVARVMNALDALVLMSRTTRSWKEQFGRVIMEAQACGVPVIGSDSGSIPGVVGPGGWVVAEGDAAALARLLARLAAAPDEVARAGAAGYAQANTRFSVATVAHALADAFVRAAASRRAMQGQLVQGRSVQARIA
jgi:glycosyltransferase involved in cell wall biosynthesis